VHEGVFFAGCLANEALARLLKRALKHPRPAATCARLNLCHSHGMPSSHTQMMAFLLALSACLALYRRRRLKPELTALKATPAKELARSLLAAAELLALAGATVVVGASRVYLGYHSPDQVAAGAMVGGAFGLLWFRLMVALAPLYGRAAALAPCYWLDVRDTWGLGERVHALERDFVALGAAAAPGGAAKKER
jgi:membrane-associated phospholipid phosphatase